MGFEEPTSSSSKSKRPTFCFKVFLSHNIRPCVKTLKPSRHATSPSLLFFFHTNLMVPNSYFHPGRKGAAEIETRYGCIQQPHGCWLRRPWRLRRWTGLLPDPPPPATNAASRQGIHERSSPRIHAYPDRWRS